MYGQLELSTDGGALDEDNTANSTIVDPIYIGVVNGASTTVGSLSSTGGMFWGIVAVAFSMTGISVAIALKSVRRRKYVGFTR